MKLLFLADANSVHSWRWIEFFADRGHEIHWVSLVPFPRSAPRGIRTYEVGRYPRGPVSLGRAVSITHRVGRDVRPDVFHVHSVGTYGVVGAMAGIRPLLATAWGSDVLIATQQRVKRALVSWVLRRADLITCDAHHMRDAIVDLGADPSKIRVIFFGTDVTRFRPRDNGTQPPAFFPRDGKVLILSTRNLHPIYDVGTLIRAIPHIIEHVPGARFVIVGEGEEREALIGLSRNLGLDASVVFAGAIAADEMPLALAAADIYVSTSLSDAGLAASTAEAMACGLPVVVTDSGENRIWVEDGGGYVIPVRNSTALAEAILRLASDAELRSRFGGHNRKVIEERNNYHLEMRRVEETYQQLAAIHS